MTTPLIRPGLEVFAAAPNVRGRVGLLSNVASVARDGSTALATLRSAGVDITVIFSPEHGYFGLGSAGESMSDAQLDGVPITSLYGASYAPQAALLTPLSAVLVDLQDTGNRWYTYLGTITQLLRACAQTRTPVIILDRPNPQSGAVVEGPLAEPAFFSLVAPAAFPVRYGMTIGEGARLINRDISADLRVIPVEGWQRLMTYAETGLVWPSPSPNMPHAETTLAYTGTCLFEATNISEGRGTPLPFEQIGAPYLRAEALAGALNDLSLPGVLFTPAWFRPSVHKYVGQSCQGVRLHVTDPHTIRGFTVALYMIAALRRLYPAEFTWQVENGVNIFDRLAATARVRTAFEQGQPAAEIAAWCDSEAQQFRKESKTIWLYPSSM